MLASYLHRLDARAARHRDAEHRASRLQAAQRGGVFGKGAKASALADVPASAALAFACERADLALQLARVLRGQADGRTGWTALYEDLEWPLVPVLMAIEQAGVQVDTAALGVAVADARRRDAGAQHADLRARGRGVQHQLAEAARRDPVREAQAAGAARRRARRESASTAVDVLEELALTHELPRLMLDWRTHAEAERHLHRRAARCW